MQFRLFVYGTLKQGQRNFAHYCRGVLAIEPAQVLGRLYYLSHGYHLSYGYPMLEVPPEHILARGTQDYLGDARLLERLSCEAPAASAAVQGDWQPIEGEIHTFADPAERLAALDRLENFQPEGESLYHRVIVRTQPPQSRLVWTYVAAGGRIPPDAVRTAARWP
jgi:gamma-glutamylcyclotransferase (GGCT)/AIG2-like uncharacterized protein YtfP